MPYAVLTAVLVAIDQLVKFLVKNNISSGEHVPFLPHLLDLTYVENTGAAFSLFAQHTWALTLVSLVVSIVLAVAIRKNFFHHPLGKLSLTLILAGAVGNLLDRAFRGYVVDMFNVLFMQFAVFNVADMCVVTGGIAAALYYLFLAQKLEPQEGETNEPADPDR